LFLAGYLKGVHEPDDDHPRLLLLADGRLDERLQLILEDKKNKKQKKWTSFVSKRNTVTFLCCTTAHQ
jgi:hypothetical protein